MLIYQRVDESAIKIACFLSRPESMSQSYPWQPGTAPGLTHGWHPATVLTKRETSRSASCAFGIGVAVMGSGQNGLSSYKKR